MFANPIEKFTSVCHSTFEVTWEIYLYLSLQFWSYNDVIKLSLF